jgi:hypothetical protein
MSLEISARSDKIKTMNTNLRYCAALDLHAENCVLGWMTLEGKMVNAKRFSTTEEQLLNHIRQLGKKGVVLIIEMGPMTRWAVRILRPYVQRLIVCDPRRNKLVSCNPHKNDWSDVENLCELARMGSFKEVWVGEDSRRELFRSTVYEFLGWRDEQRHLKTLIKAKYHTWGITRFNGKAVFNKKGRAEYLKRLAEPEQRILMERLYRQYDQAWSLWLETKAQVKRMGKAYPEIEQFQKITGVADVGAHVFSAMIEFPHRFATHQQVWRFSRLGITDRTSDNKPLGYQKIDRAGHGELKNVSYTAWRTACKKTTGDNEVRRFYQASLKRTGSVRHARLNTQRKIIQVMWTIWRKNINYEPEMFFPTATPTNEPKGVAGLQGE